MKRHSTRETFYQFSRMFLWPIFRRMLFDRFNESFFFSPSLSTFSSSCFLIGFPVPQLMCNWHNNKKSHWMHKIASFFFFFFDILDFISIVWWHPQKLRSSEMMFAFATIRCECANCAAFWLSSYDWIDHTVLIDAELVAFNHCPQFCNWIKN